MRSTEQILSSARELVCLLGIGIRSQWRALVEFVRVVRRYYPNKKFRRLDMALSAPYFLRSPYRISKHFLKQRGAADIYTYGETPLTTLEQIARNAELSSDDLLFDLGCGPGRTSLWLHNFIGCRIIGIEQIPLFVERAQDLIQRFQLDHIEFRQADLRDIDYTEATAIYLYGTCFDEEFLAPLIAKLRKTRPGTKIITVSYELNEFSREPYFKLIRQFPAHYPWGETQIFLQTPKDEKLLVSSETCC